MPVMRYLREWMRERILPVMRYLILANRYGGAIRMPDLADGMATRSGRGNAHYVRFRDPCAPLGCNQVSSPIRPVVQARTTANGPTDRCLAGNSHPPPQTRMPHRATKGCLDHEPIIADRDRSKVGLLAGSG